MGNRIFGRFLALFMSAAATAGPGVAQTNERPIVRLVTSVGDIDIQLAQALAPRTVDNFLRLVDDGFYNGLIFHGWWRASSSRQGAMTPNSTSARRRPR